MKVAVVNVGVGGWHPKGSRRMAEAFQAVSITAQPDLLQWTTTYPEGCRPHGEVPYQFKPFAFNQALSKGYDIVIWLDSSIWPKKDIQPVIDLTIKQGYFFIRNGWTAGEWLCDDQLTALGLTRDEALQIPQLIGGCMALDLRQDHALWFLKSWLDYSSSFVGEWTNTGKCSADSRVLGSRHDQAFASVIAHRLGMTQWVNPQGWLSYTPSDDVIFAAQGM